jgi:ppGpp synthetase/RelA/SpoT-type nucleotidyltranferase
VRGAPHRSDAGMAPQPLPSTDTQAPPIDGATAMPQGDPGTPAPEHDLAALFRLSNLSDLLETYLERPQLDIVHRAYLFGARAHSGQLRKTGESYICHPLDVAHMLAEMHLDVDSIVAALLHDVIEDTRVTKKELAAEFGDEVAELVDGVSKLTKMELENPDEAQAENFRKMMMAMVRDLRVILIKLADRLHNMRTLSVMAPAKRRRIARETLDIYVPIANRLGMNTIRLELEDLGFAALYPMRYRVIQDAVRKARGNRREVMQRLETAIKERLRHEELNARVVGREKHLYSIYRKMTTKGLSLAEVLDVYAIRIIVEGVETCYRVLGIVHNLFKPLPGKFKDYIAIPKSNGYQSLHTVLFGPPGVPIEIQIRTEDMNKVAEAGVAAHWLYKSSRDTGNTAHARAREWLQSLLEMQRASARDAARQRRPGRVPRERQDRPVPRRGLRVHAEGPDHGAAARRDRGRLRLRRALGHRQQLRRGQDQPAHDAPVHATAERPDHRDHHLAGRAPEPGLAELRGHRQGALEHPQLPQEPDPRGRGPARPLSARTRPR